MMAIKAETVMRYVTFMLPFVMGLTMLCTLSVANSAHAGKIQIVVHKDNGVPTLTRRDLQRLFKVSKKQWDDGNQVILLLPPTDSRAMAFLVNEVFKVRGVSAVSMFYLKAAFQQKLTSTPASTLNIPDAVQKISELRGAVTLIDANTVPTHTGVRIFPIE